MKGKLITVFSLFASSILMSQNVFALPALELKRGNGSSIHYYLASNKYPSESLLVLIQGSDCNSVYHNKRINDEFSQVLPRADVLTVEKYGITSQLAWNSDPERADCPQAYIENDSPKQRVQDYTQVLGALREDGKYKKIVLVGGSEGAMVVNLLAAQLEYIDASVSLNGGAPSFIDDVLHNIASQSLPPEAYEEAKNGFIGFSQHVLNSEPFELNMSGHGYQWWRNMFEINQTQILSKVNTPLLLIQAGKDQNVSVSLAVAQAQTLSKDNPNIEFKLYNDLDHAFKLPNGKSGVNEVIKDIRAWLAQH